MGHSCIKLKLPSWESSSFVCGLTAQYCSNLFTSIVSDALLALWITVCAEGSQSAEYTIDIFHKVLKKNKLLSKPPCKDPTSAKKKREIEKFKLKAYKFSMMVQALLILILVVLGMLSSEMERKSWLVLKLFPLVQIMLVNSKAVSWD